ncbi:MAG: hypothetical protein M3S32_03755 [Acidobacteriota bacterium]|nr:hypothetical protein [Acidobacteriota bacterium]
MAVPLHAAPGKARVFTGTITDTECGPSHRRMLARGGMGTDAASCTRACIRRGATYGVLAGTPRRFYQLDDQEKPAAFAGKRVRILGRRQGDTILVETMEGIH